jgi:hypothetical protein
MTPNNHASQDRGGEIPEAFLDAARNECNGWSFDGKSNFMYAARWAYRYLSTHPSSASSQGSMEWVKATERNPESEGRYAIKFCGKYGCGSFKNGWWCDDHSGSLYHSDVQWLYEPAELPSISPDTKR